MTAEVGTELTPDQLEALQIARDLAAAGIPVFVAAPDPGSPVGFALPNAWQQTVPDPAVVDRWRPGMALCAVMGCGLDLLDLDTRNGAQLDSLEQVPVSYGIAETPSDGYHSFIKSLGCGSRDDVYPGIDVKSGMLDGSGRGFAFIAPTVKVSKVTGELASYRWAQRPDLQRLAAAGNDTSGEKLAARVRELKANTAGMTKLAGPEWFQKFMASREPQSQLAADRAIAEKLREVREWAPGEGTGFRLTLLRAALTLGGYVGGGYLDEDDARDRLEAAVSEVWEAPDEDDQLWITQGLNDGQHQPFEVYTPEDEAVWLETQANGPHRPQDGENTGADQDEPPWTDYSAIGSEPFDPTYANTDQELAEQVAIRMTPGLRFGVDSGTWLVRNRYRWEECGERASWAVATVARLMPVGQTPVPKEVSERTELHWQAVRRAKFFTSSGASAVERKLKAVMHSRAFGGIDVASMDADPEILWAGGWAWDLAESGNGPLIADIDPATPHLHTARFAPSPIATPYWDRFIAAVWPEEDMRAWALRVLSICLAGYPDAALPVLYGPERTGKTQVITLLVDALGSYGHAADARLLAGADNAHASVVYALKGRRLSFIDEGPRRGHLATERLKQITGGGHLTGNAMRANPVTFAPTHTLVMTTNDEPPITDPALRARMRIIPCEADKTLVRQARQALTPAIWRAEAPGVLAKFMVECARWLSDRDSAGNEVAPDLQREAVEDMAAAQNPVREWVENSTVPADPGTPGRELYKAFLAWFEGQPGNRRITPPSETAFGRTLTEQGYPATKIGRGNDRKKFRPLSVLGGLAGMAPTGPAPTAHVVPSGTPSGTARGASGAGSEPQPSPAENGSSSPVFSSFGDSGDSTHNTIDEETHTHNTKEVIVENTQRNREQTGHSPHPGGKSSADQQGPVRDGADPHPAPPLAQSVTPATPRASTQDDQAKQVQDPPAEFAESAADLRKLSDLGIDLPSGLPDGYSPLRNVTPLQVTHWANARGIDKTAARAELKEFKRQVRVAEKAAARQTKINAAAGEPHELPAAADAAGNVVALTLEQAAQTVRRRLNWTQGALTVDVETSGYPLGHEYYRLRTVQLGDEQAAVVFDAGNAEQIALVSQLLGEAATLHAHSATADLVPLVHVGAIELESSWDRMLDTVIPAKLADPQSTGSDPGLKKLGPAVLGARSVSSSADAARSKLFKTAGWLTETKVSSPIEKSGWAQVDSRCETMIRYAASDVLDTAALARQLPTIPAPILARERLAQRMTARVAHHGVALDYQHVQAKLAEHEPARAEAGARVRELGAGCVENPGSDKQIAQAALQLGAQLPLTEAGNPSVAKDVLEPLKHAEGQLGAFVRAVLDYRHHDTVLGTFLEPYRLLCERGDGRARPTVYTLGTDTGRMSCVRPNLQQLPRQGGVRACITADPGQLMIGADFSGVELRVAAALSGDPNLRQILADGRDIHEEVALQVWGADPERSAEAGKPKPLKEHRYVAKRMVFGRVYGGGASTLAAQTGTTQATAHAVIETLDAMTPGLAQWSESIRQAVKAGHTQFQSYSGRVIHLPADFPHKGPNYCIQGTARELLVDALVRWSGTPWGQAVLLPVHDELDAFVPAEDAEAATAELIRCMESELFGVRIISDPSAPAFAWADSS